MIRHARDFNESVQYLMGPSPVAVRRHVPSSLKRLMNEVAGVESLGDQTMREILRDDQARRVRFLVFLYLVHS